MKSYEEVKRILRIHPDPEVDASCRYLEQLGQVFCVHFGTVNATEKAPRDLLRSRCGAIQ